jgi:hypothetical protein
MIYLFDDTNPRYITQYINLLEYTDVIEHVSGACLNDVLQMEPALLDAEWIFIHKSFKDSDGRPRKVFEKVSYDIANDGDDVPLLWFSDEDLANPHIDEDCDNFIDGYKKSVFYSRLSKFLEDRRQTGHSKIELLLYGEGQEQLTPVVAAENLLNDLRDKDNNELVSLAELSSSDLMHLVNTSRPQIGIEYLTIVKKIENGEMTVKEFRENIRSIAESYIVYGTNIHNWK